MICQFIQLSANFNWQYLRLALFTTFTSRVRRRRRRRRGKMFSKLFRLDLVVLDWKPALWWTKCLCLNQCFVWRSSTTKKPMDGSRIPAQRLALAVMRRSFGLGGWFGHCAKWESGAGEFHSKTFGVDSEQVSTIDRVQRVIEIFPGWATVRTAISCNLIATTQRGREQSSV